MSQSLSEKWFVRFSKSEKPQLRLFCFHHAGGGASAFNNWCDTLPGQVELCAVQLPGRERRFREEPYRRIATLVADFVEEIRRYAGVPFAFFGHSMGACIAFEVAIRLQAKGLPEPIQLFLAGRKAPNFPDEEPPLHDLPKDELIAKLRSIGGTSAIVFEHKELLDFILPALRADFEILDTYRYEQAEPLRCPIAAYGGKEDVRVSEDAVNGWAMYTSSGFTSRMFEGGHFFVRDFREELLREINATLGMFLANIDNRCCRMSQDRD